MNIEVKLGDIAVAENSDNLATSGIGSCLIVALYAPKLKIGALAHTMLPARRSSYGVRDASSENPIRNTQYAIPDTRYVDAAVDEMLKRMLRYEGVKKQDLEAKIIGGANIFPTLNLDIGKQNVVSAKGKLKKEGIKIVGECVGGSIGRSVEFCIASGIVVVKTRF